MLFNACVISENAFSILRMGLLLTVAIPQNLINGKLGYGLPILTLEDLHTPDFNGPPAILLYSQADKASLPCNLINRML